MSIDQSRPLEKEKGTSILVSYIQVEYIGACLL